MVVDGDAVVGVADPLPRFWRGCDDGFDFRLGAFLHEGGEVGGASDFAEVGDEVAFLNELVAQDAKTAAGFEEGDGSLNAVFLGEHVRAVVCSFGVEVVFEKGVRHSAVHGAEVFGGGHEDVDMREEFPVAAVSDEADETVFLRVGVSEGVGTVELGARLELFDGHGCRFGGGKHVHDGADDVLPDEFVEFLPS